MQHYVYFFLLLLIQMNVSPAKAQTAFIQGKVFSEEKPIVAASITVNRGAFGTTTDSMGLFELHTLPSGTYTLEISAMGYRTTHSKLTLQTHDSLYVNIAIESLQQAMDEVVVSGTMKERVRSESPVPVEVYSANFFKRNPTPAIFDALQNINGVRPQINCNVCNTGDIHINGMEGPYTLVLIDGMPIVSGLASVYGLSGIPQSLIDRIEIVKGPASTLYGSEAVGGLINIITVPPHKAPLFSADIFATSWAEINTDIASRFKVGKHTNALLGLHYFNYSKPIDQNHDGFTDITLQKRISIFNTWNFSGKQNQYFSLAGRFLYEDRWGGDMNWTKKFRAGDSLYAESIYTARWELFGKYQFPGAKDWSLQFSANRHDQNSVYGRTVFNAKQQIAFAQLTHNIMRGKHDIMTGLSFRYSYYDDNTVATARVDSLGVPHNQASQSYLPGLFVQDEIALSLQHKLLIGLRYDYNSLHGSILTPRLNYKWNSSDKNNVLRLSIGNGYRIAHVFTEDHAALTGARTVIFRSDLKPETSWNVNLNFVKKIYTQNGNFISVDASSFYTYFTNKILADYESDPNKIIYDNLQGYAISRGVSLHVDLNLNNGLQIITGATWMDVYSMENAIKKRQLFTEKFTGVWSVGYTVQPWRVRLDYTGNVYSPMRLPLLSDTDPRTPTSPWWSIQNIQITKKWKNGFELYAGIKNLLNWTPNKGNPFIIARAHDPFDKEVEFNTDGQAMITPDNPYGLTFDPSYVYGPNQGIRGFLGARIYIKEKMR